MELPDFVSYRRIEGLVNDKILLHDTRLDYHHGVLDNHWLDLGACRSTIESNSFFIQDIVEIFVWIMCCGNCFRACSCARVRCLDELNPLSGCPKWGNAEVIRPGANPLLSNQYL